MSNGDHLTGPRLSSIVAAAILGGAVAGLSTYLPDLLTATGSALVSALAAAFSALMATALLDSRHRARVLCAALAVGVLAGAVVVRTSGSTSIVGGCEKFLVFAQNRWAPLGAAVRDRPAGGSRKIGSFGPNAEIYVDGWVQGPTAHPKNRPPWNSDVWFHVADDQGWVSFGGVRSEATTVDPTGLADGGPPVPADPRCHGSARF